jgi:hypothetical protein
MIDLLCSLLHSRLIVSEWPSLPPAPSPALTFLPTISLLPSEPGHLDKEHAENTLTFAEAQCVCRVLPTEDRTNGFFLACFTRDGDSGGGGVGVGGSEGPSPGKKKRPSAKKRRASLGAETAGGSGSSATASVLTAVHATAGKKRKAARAAATSAATVPAPAPTPREQTTRPPQRLPAASPGAEQAPVRNVVALGEEAPAAGGPKKRKRPSAKQRKAASAKLARQPDDDQSR